MASSLRRRSAPMVFVVLLAVSVLFGAVVVVEALELIDTAPPVAVVPIVVVAAPEVLTVVAPVRFVVPATSKV